MAKLTVRKSGRVPRHQSNPTTRSEISSTSKSINKRVKSNKFTHSRNIQTVDDEDDEDKDEDIRPSRKAVKDVSGELFTIKFSCFLDDLCVYEDTNYVTLGEFSFREFDTQSLRKVDIVAKELNGGFEWVSGQAIISGNKIRVADNPSIIVSDEQGWKKVERGIELAMKDNKTSINVKLIIRYKRKGGMITVISDDEAGDLKKVHMSQCC